jgi:signal transduction histidine kinase
LPSYWEVSIGPFRKAGQIAGFVLSTMEVTEKERLIQQRDDFASALSHNLKTPLVGAERVLETLLNGSLGTLNEQQEELLAQLQKSNHDLLNMVQDLIEVYRYETKAANLSFEDISLEMAVQDCLSKFASASEAKNIELLPLVRPGLPHIYGDKAAIARLLANLIDNAIKFTNPGGIVEIGAVSKGDSIVLTVKDNGVGMMVGDPDKLFSRFWQGAGKTYPAVTGLGLYLCRQIADAHFGHIAVSSRPNQGTIVSVTLPLKSTQQN